MKVVESRTIKREEANGRAEREFTIDFQPGELKADDTPSIKKWCKDMSDLCKCSIDESMPQPSAPTQPQQDKTEPTSASVKQIGFIKDLLNQHKPKYPNIEKELLEQYRIKILGELTKDQANGAIKLLKEKK